MTTYNKGMTLEQFTYTNYGVSLTSQQKRQALSEFIAHEKSNKIATYETGATSHAVNDLILFTDNTRRTAERRDEIYKKYIKPSKKLKDWQKSMESEFEKVLCPYAMHQYWVEHGESNSKHIANIGKDGHKEFASLYASDFGNWKSEHGYK